jgi:hypothetical protein
MGDSGNNVIDRENTGWPTLCGSDDEYSVTVIENSIEGRIFHI